ncbi:MAG: N-acetyltransferase [Alcaligenaceae bacterium]|nr:N-acetyltransferase [Alcaligenaceae bacterium]
MHTAVILRTANETDLHGILAIYNHAVRHTTAIWNETEVDLENRRAWLQLRQSKNFPVLVAVEENNILGYASYGEWRAFDGYRHTVEHSIYIHEQARGRGLGRQLMQALIEHARTQNIHVMIAGIDASNQASIRLHESLGFKHAGLFREVGIKFGKWLDLCCMQLTLDDGRK